MGSRKKRLNNVEYFLKKFEYRKALDAALASVASVSFSMGFLDELSQRNAITIAVANRDETSCINILQWIHRMVQIPEVAIYRNLLIELTGCLIESNECLKHATSPAVVYMLSRINTSG